MGDSRKSRGHITAISKLSGVPHETVRRYFFGRNVGFESVDKIRKAEQELTSSTEIDVRIEFDPREAELLMDALWSYGRTIADKQQYGDTRICRIRKLWEKICVAKHYAENAEES